ncbi:MAG: hypothetical protein JWM96_574 [Alphaproteobacteria bacterium]|nr:hypothetical protein [Alphaproteobacteria bacterium]
MFSLKTPWSRYAVEVGFVPVQEREAAGRFLTINTPDLYRSHVIEALRHGKPMRKTASIFAWPLGIAQEWATQDISGQAETAKAIKADLKEELFLVFSSHEYDYKQAYQTYMLVHNMAAMAKSSLTTEELLDLHTGEAHFSLNTSVYGIWTIGADSLASKYSKFDDQRFPDVYQPKPEALRIIAPVKATEGYDGIEMPTSWGSFKIRNGGHIAIAIAEDNAHLTGYQQLLRNLEAVDKGEGVFEELFLVEKKGALRSTLDIYGIEPGFVESNYDVVAMGN